MASLEIFGALKLPYSYFASWKALEYLENLRKYKKRVIRPALLSQAAHSAWNQTEATRLGTGPKLPSLVWPVRPIWPNGIQRRAHTRLPPDNALGFHCHPPARCHGAVLILIKCPSKPRLSFPPRWIPHLASPLASALLCSLKHPASHAPCCRRPRARCLRPHTMHPSPSRAVSQCGHTNSHVGHFSILEELTIDDHLRTLSTLGSASPSSA
jgi:hypothetical protein